MVLESIPGASIKELAYAWRLDYRKEPRPQRVLLVAGLNKLIKCGGANHFKEQVLQFEDHGVHHNRYNIPKLNEMIVALLILPPKLCWFPDNGPPPLGYTNRLLDCGV